MKRGAALRGGYLRLVLGLWVVGTSSACGGRTASEDESLFDDGLMVGPGEVLEVTNGASTTASSAPAVVTTSVAPGVSTGFVPPPSRPPTPPPPVTNRPPSIPPSVPPAVPPTAVTVLPDITSEWWDSSEPTLTTDSPTTDPTTTDPTTTDPTTTDPTTTDPTTTDPTTMPDPSTDVTTEPPPEPFDPLHPTDGTAPLGLPIEYANVAWKDIYSDCGHNGWSSSYSCTTSFSCDEGPGYSSCDLGGDGIWYCACNGFDGRYQTITVPDAIIAKSDTDACRLSAAICLTDAPPTSEPTCSDAQSQYETYCYRSRNCTEPFASSYGEFTRSEERSSASCDSSQDPDRGDCYCSTKGVPHSFSMVVPREDQCATAIDVCEAGIEAGSEGEVECSWYSRRFGVYDCQNAYHCSQTATSSGVAVTTLEDLNVSCSGSGSSWTCNCGYDWYDYETLTAEDSTAACDLAAEHCRAGLGSLFSEVQ